MNTTEWDQWKDYLLYECHRRMKNMISMGGQFVKNQKGISTIFILSDPLPLPLDAVIPEIMKMIKNGGSVSAGNNQNGDISMLGHRFGMFGMIESIDNLYKYFIEAYQSLKLKGQIIVTSIKFPDLDSSRQQHQDIGEIRFQYGNLYGPYFGLFFIDPDFFQNQVQKTSWQLKMLYKQEEGGYSVLLT